MDNPLEMNCVITLFVLLLFDHKPSCIHLSFFLVVPNVFQPLVLKVNCTLHFPKMSILLLELVFPVELVVVVIVPCCW